MLEEFLKDYEALKHRVEVLEMAKAQEEDDPCRDLPEVLKVEDVMKFLGIGKSTAYEFMGRYGFRFGKTVRITRRQLRSGMNEQREEKNETERR